MNAPRILLAGLLALATPALAAEPTPAAAVDQAGVPALVERVEARYAKVDTIRAAFTQTKVDAFGKTVQDGEVVLARPARMRWHFTTGDERLMGSDGQTLWVWTKADDFYSEYAVPPEASATSQAFLTSLDTLDEHFEVELVSTDGGPTLDLVPRSKGQIARMRLALTEDLTVRQVTFIDVYDNVTELAFRDVALNAPVDDTLFRPLRPSQATED